MHEINLMIFVLIKEDNCDLMFVINKVNKVGLDFKRAILTCDLWPATCDLWPAEYTNRQNTFYNRDSVCCTLPFNAQKDLELDRFPINALQSYSADKLAFSVLLRCFWWATPLEGISLGEGDFTWSHSCVSKISFVKSKALPNRAKHMHKIERNGTIYYLGSKF